MIRYTIRDNFLKKFVWKKDHMRTFDISAATYENGKNNVQIKYDEMSQEILIRNSPSKFIKSSSKKKPKKLLLYYIMEVKEEDEEIVLEPVKRSLF